MSCAASGPARERLVRTNKLASEMARQFDWLKVMMEAFVEEVAAMKAGQG